MIFPHFKEDDDGQPALGVRKRGKRKKRIAANENGSIEGMEEEKELREGSIRRGPGSGGLGSSTLLGLDGHLPCPQPKKWGVGIEINLLRLGRNRYFFVGGEKSEWAKGG